MNKHGNELAQKFIDGRFWIERGYVLPDYRFDRFAPGSRVLDIGCGPGEQLEDVIRNGSTGIGIDISEEDLTICRSKGLIVHNSPGEKLPFKDASFNGVICKVTLSYMDESKVLSEISRVIQSGGHVELCTHGLGHYVLLCLFRCSRDHGYWKWPIINAWRYTITGKWRGEMYQSKRRLKKYFKEFDLMIENYTQSKSFLGMPVFLYYRLKKS